MNVQETVNQYESYGIELRRQIHRHPELSNKEHNTTAFIQAELAKSGIEPVDLGLDRPCGGHPRQKARRRPDGGHPGGH